jgi:hypothetical protein
METMETLKSRLAQLEKTDRAFRSVGVVLVVLGCVVFGGGALRLLASALSQAPVLTVMRDLEEVVFRSAIYFLLAWVARRIAEAFRSIVTLIQEVGEIV